MSPVEALVGPSVLEHLMAALPSLRAHHAPGSPVYELLKGIARRDVESLFADEQPCAKAFRPFGELIFPYHRMGAVDSLNLFDLDELILFSFYWVNRHRYRRVLDIGANLGLHAMLLSRCGFEVRAYEPDPQHYERLQQHLALNGCAHVETRNAALSSHAGVMPFIRVLGNTTGNHLAGSKPAPYGALERFPVAVEAIEPQARWADLIKLDAEGHEREILLAINPSTWHATDALVEVGSADNASAIYEHFRTLGVHLFSQHTNWQAVHARHQMPTSHHDGTLFITMKPAMPWAATPEVSH